MVNNIESGLAFFVKAGATGGSIQITESSKVSGSVNVFRTVEANSPMLRSTLYAVTADSRTLLDAAMVNIDAAVSYTHLDVYKRQTLPWPTAASVHLRLQTAAAAGSSP